MLGRSVTLAPTAALATLATLARGAGAHFGVDPASMFVDSKGDAPDHVDCGAHFAETCRACTYGAGKAWCNGQCVWADDACQDKHPWASLPSFQVTNGSLPWLSSLMAALGVCLTAAIALCYASIYKKKVVDELPHKLIQQRGPDSEYRQERKVGIFDVLSEPNTCMWAFLCPSVLAAKNYQVGQVVGFWPSCITLFCFMYSPFYCIAALLRTYWSMALKRNLGYKTNSFTDCCLSLFCFWCEVGRESLEVDTAIGAKVKCAFQVELTVFAEIEEVIKEIEEDFSPQHFLHRDRRCCAPGLGH